MAKHLKAPPRDPMACRWCHIVVPGRTPASRNWYCPVCRRFDAIECLLCRMREGFPLAKPWSTGPVAMVSDSALKKANVYCEWDYHQAFFVVPTPDGERCLICETSWRNGELATHGPAVRMRAG